MFKRLNIKILCITIIAQFLMSSLLHLRIQIPSFLTPLQLVSSTPSKIDNWPTIQGKLSSIENNYQVNTPKSFVKSALASGEYEEASGYAVIDFESGDVIASKNIDKKLPIASLTKIMTAVVALDLASPDQLMTVSEHAASIEPTKMGVIPGQAWTTQELVTAMLLTSANDASEVLKEGIANLYGQEVFVKAMNYKASQIGLKSSSFTNPQGFDNKDHYSSVQDLALLSHYALTHYPLIKQIAQQDYQFYPATKTHKQADLYNWNGLLGVYPNIEGLKIGNTGDAGYTTVVLSSRENRKMMSIVLGAPGVLERDLWAGSLLDLGYNQVLGLNPVGITETQLKTKYQTWKYFN
jgi:D-alanyl-D-alanine carboxypeptidase